MSQSTTILQAGREKTPKSQRLEPELNQSFLSKSGGFEKSTDAHVASAPSL